MFDYHRERKRKWFNDHPEYYRKRNGLPEPTRLMPALCECCGGLPNGQGTFHLDHCHITGKFRGWLCYKCNTAIGYLGDDIEGLQKAIDYLKKP